MTELTERLAEYALAERAGVLPEAVVRHARRALIDWFAAMLPGTLMPPAAMLCQALPDEMRGSGAIVYANGRRAGLRTAALINATAAHTAEFDDIFRDAVYHPGAPVIAAALAAAQARGADGRALLAAIVIGYEVSTRIGLAVMPSHYRHWHTTGTVGTFGAAAAAASILGLDKGAFAHALATAASFAAGLRQALHAEAMTKPLHAGHAAEAGALAALAAGAGVSGARGALDGAGGFGAAMSEAPDWRGALEGLGERRNITAMTFKNHGCCGHIFAAIDGMLALTASEGISASNLARARIGTYRAAVEVTDRPLVTTAFEGRFSTQFSVATALVHGRVRLAAFSPAGIADPAVRRLMPLISVTVDPECEAAFPRHRSAVLEVETTDGRKRRHFQPTRKGDPDLALSDAELADKFFELTEPVIGRAAARELYGTLSALGPGDRVDFLADRRHPALAPAG